MIDDIANEQDRNKSEPLDEAREFLFEEINERIEKYYPVVYGISSKKDELFPPNKAESEETQRSVDYIVGNISTRGRGARKYHDEIVKYGNLKSDDAEIIEKKEEYRQTILRGAIEFGFVSDSVLSPENEIEAKLGISSIPEKIDSKVEAIIIPGAAGLSSAKRFYHAVKGIRTGAYLTDTIIFAACSRHTENEEMDTMQDAQDIFDKIDGDTSRIGIHPRFVKKSASDAGESYQGFDDDEIDPYTPRRSEFELALEAVNNKTIGGGIIEGSLQESESSVTFSGIEYPFRVASCQILVDGKPITVRIVDSPYDKTRVLDKKTGKLTDRANSEEELLATLTILEDNGVGNTVCLISHDTWIPNQIDAAKYTIGFKSGRKIVGSGPRNLSRTFINSHGDLDIFQAEAVVDEMSKSMNEQAKLHALQSEETGRK